MTLKRSSTPSEEKNTAKAMVALLDSITLTTEKDKSIEFEHLRSAMWTLLIKWHSEDMAYENFCKMLEGAKEHFKLLQGKE